MIDNVNVKDYISNMLLDGECGGYVELVTFTELYSVLVLIFDSIKVSSLSQQLLYQIILKDHKVLSSEFKVKISLLIKLVREDKFVNEHQTNH